MIKTLYTCDKCKQTQYTSEQFWSIGVWASHVGASYNHSAQQHGKGIQVCRPCLETLGVNVMRTNPKAAEYNERSVEDILVELLERIGK